MAPELDAPAPGVAASGLELYLFGPIDVRLRSRPLPRLRSRKGHWLLALLALRAGRSLDRGWLAATLWPDADPPAALRSLRQCLHDLRQALGPEAGRLGCEAPRTLRLDVAGAFVDVLAFAAALARGDRESLEGAVRLYRGPFLEDCAEAWSLEERQRWEGAYVGALEQLAAGARGRGEHGAAASYLRLAVSADAHREDLQRGLMEALAEGGNPGAALQAYQEYRTLLWREMAAEPAEETTALFRRLRDETRARAQPAARAVAASAPLAPRPSSLPPASRSLPELAGSHDPIVPSFEAFGPKGNLPQPLSAFVGRERDLLEVGARLAGARLVTLTGIGGIGKTRLALRVAEEHAWEYADGAWFVDLAALADAALLPQAVARALRVREAPGSPLTETLQEALAARRLLLVLDNCEHLIDACACLASALLSSCPHVRILATSRQPLGLTGEVVWPVSSLSLPEAAVLRAERQVRGAGHPPERREGRAAAAHGVDGSPDAGRLEDASTAHPGPRPAHASVSELLQYEAIHLFVQRAAAASSGFVLGENNAAATVQVCRRLDGIPLAIELAAARLRALSIAQLAARLDDRFRLLTGGSRAALPRQQTLRATMDWSHDLLPEPERILLRRLSVFTGGFTLAAAEAVCSDGISDVLDLLTQLVDRSLVGVQRRGGPARYALLETTREYARDRLREAGEEEEQCARHGQFFLALAERAEPELRGAAQAEWLRRLEEEHDNFCAAMDYFLARSAVEEGLRLGSALGGFWWMRGYFSEGRERLQMLLAQSGYEFEASEPGREVRLAPPAETAGLLEQRAPSVRLAQAKALSAAGVLADDQGEYEAARALFQESLVLSRELGDLPATATALNNLGGLARRARDCPAARALYEESLAIWRALADPWWTATALTNLGCVAILEGEYATARGLVESALEIQRELQNRRVIARSLTLLGTIAARLGDYEAAQALHEEGLSIVRELGAPGPIEQTLRALGSVARDRGDAAAARAFHEERLAIARDVGSAWGIAESLYYLGLLARDRGDRSRAGTLWSESLAISQRLGDSQRIAECLEGFASLAAPSGSMERGQRKPESSGSHDTGEGADGARRAARLFGAAAALREIAGAPVDSRRRAEYERQVAAARAAMDAAGFAVAWAEGCTMTLDQAIADALRGAGESPG